MSSRRPRSPRAPRRNDRRRKRRVDVPISSISLRTIAIDSGLIGTKSNFLIDAEGFRWSTSTPRDSWVLDGNFKSGACLDTVLALEGRKVPSPPERYVKAYESLKVKGPVPWRHCMPRDTFREFFYSVVDVASSVKEDYSYDYVVSAWNAGARVLASLRPCKVDVDLFRRLSENELTASQTSTFEPNRLGFAGVPKYDRMRTKTGRLVVVEGPSILTLPQAMRGILTSSYDEGSIISLDFHAIEPKIVLAEARGVVPRADVDLYDEISRVLFDGVVCRDDVKRCVISVLYGAGRDSIVRSLKTVSPSEVDEFRSIIRKYFDVDRLTDRLASSKSGDVLRNRFGRPLRVEEGSNLLNLYTQSTGVDVALMGFDSVMHSLGTDGIRPVFVLHDALILDVRKDRIEDVMGFTSVDVPSFDGTFSLKPTSLNVQE